MPTSQGEFVRGKNIRYHAYMADESDRLRPRKVLLGQHFVNKLRFWKQ
jgi:hypothetical protein